MHWNGKTSFGFGVNALEFETPFGFGVNALEMEIPFGFGVQGVLRGSQGGFGAPEEDLGVLRADLGVLIVV